MSTQPDKPQVKWLFATPVIGFIHPNASLLNVSLWDDVYKLRQQTAGLQRSNRNGWHSNDDLFTRPESSLSTLRDWIIGCSKQSCSFLNREFFQTSRKLSIQAWANINSTGSMNCPHSHPGAQWSGVYYVRVPEMQSLSSSGMIEFLDPRGGSISAQAIPGTECFSPKHSITPRSGMLLLFPSYLVHWVYPNDSPDERMSIAFNISFSSLENPAISKSRKDR